MGKKVIVVDDELVIRSLVRDILGDAGFEVIDAASGQEALQLIEREHPDLIILDINIPDKTGCGVHAVLSQRESTRDIPVIFITGYISKEEAEQTGHTLAGHILLPKPFNITDLMSAVKQVLKM